MARATRLALTTMLGIVSALSTSVPSTQQLFSIGGYIKLSETSVTRTISEYVYRATLTNTGPALSGATALATSLSPATTIVDGSLTFGAVGAGGSVVSTDTFTFRHDRTIAFSFSNIEWSIAPVVGNRAPVANAGPDQVIAGIGVTLQLDGGLSSDPDGDALTHSWTLTQRPAGSTAALTDPTTVNPTLVPDKKGTYIAQLIVNDGALSSPPDSVMITVGNTRPVANAGPDQTVNVGNLVTLNGAASSDVDGDPLTFSWQFQSRPTGSSAVLQNATSVVPTFTVDVAGSYVVRLVVNDGTVNSLVDTVTISTDNSAPVANAGPDQTVSVGQTVTLDGSASSDVDGDALTFTWTFVSRPSGSTAALSSPTAVKPTFVADRPGTYRLQLIVNDGSVNSAPDFVDITTQNTPPVANAGPDQTVFVGNTVTLNGSGSTDVDGDALTYSWSITSKPAASTAVLNNPTSVMPTFVADRPGVYVVQLVVNDGSAASAADTVAITTQNSAPIANAGPDQTVVARQTVFLDGSASSDADGNALTFAWSFTSRPAGSTATLINPLSSGPSFVTDRPGTYVVQLVVDDGTVTSAPDTVTITTTNSTPVANAGPDQANVPVGSAVQLDGSASSDADAHALTFSWSLLTRPIGSTAVLSSATVVNPTFTADLSGDYVAQLIVNDGFGPSAPDTVMIRVVSAALPDVSIVATDDSASETGDTGTFTVSRTGATTNPLTISYAVSGGATNGTDYTTLTGGVVIPAASSSALITVTPLSDGLTEGDESVVVTIGANVNYTIASPGNASVTIHDAPPVPVVTVVAFDATASEIGPEVGVFRFTRTGSTTSGLTVSYNIAGTASNGGDYTTVSDTVLIPAGLASADVTITPVNDGTPEPNETVIVTVSDAAAYDPGSPASATVTIADGSPGVTVAATDSAASETGPDTGTFTISRTGDTSAALTVNFTVGGSATPGADYGSLGTSTTIPAGQASTTVIVTPIPDALVEPDETVVLTLAPGAYAIGGASNATITIGDCASTGGTLINGALHCGVISGAGEIDTWTFTATAGDRIGVHIGETVDNNDFRPWIRLLAPNGTSLGGASGQAGLDAAVIDAVVAPTTGTYTVQVASFDSGFDGTGGYRITMTHTPGPITVTSGDQGGPLTNGALHTGEMLQGDLDVWTFTASVGERIAIHIGEITDTDDFRPWIRLWAPNGTSLGGASGQSGLDAAVIEGAVAPAAGTYLVLVGSFDSGFDGAGTYRLTMTKTMGTITVSMGDEGGPLGTVGTGEIVQGDLDVWTLNVIAGQSINLLITQTSETDDFRPWIRLWAPNGASLGGASGQSGLDVAAINVLSAPVTGTYLVLVGSFDSGFDGTGTYSLAR